MKITISHFNNIHIIKTSTYPFQLGLRLQYQIIALNIKYVLPMSAAD